MPGLREALLLMHEGDKWRVVIPPRMGFGRIGNNQLRKRDLIYELELGPRSNLPGRSRSSQEQSAQQLCGAAPGTDRRGAGVAPARALIRSLAGTSSFESGEAKRSRTPPRTAVRCPGPRLMRPYWAT